MSFRKIALVGLLAATSGTANATVIYTFTGHQAVSAGNEQYASFTYAATDFITTNRTVAATDFDSCSATIGSGCAYVQFSQVSLITPNSLNDSLEFQPFGEVGSRFDFADGAFSSFGAYLSIGGGIGTLVVSDGTAAVPEPASWALMVGGFGLLGGALRRRRMQVRFA